MTMRTNSLHDLFEKYRRWVSANPLKANDYELLTKWISYGVAGRINNSHIISELVYCLSNLLVLFNDNIIRKTQKIDPVTSGDQLKLWLTVLEYCEVLLELSATRILGRNGKWFIVVAIQFYKSISRLLLIYSHKENIIHQPPIPILQRREIKAQIEDVDTMDMAQLHLDSVSFNLRRSGKVIRKIDASPPLHVRTWKPIERAQFENNQAINKAILGQQIIAETMYIIKPIAHLASLRCFGLDSWKPWMISLLFDVGSLHLYSKSEQKLTDKQKLEISRRCASLLLYLLRSPFYDKHSKVRIETFLSSMSKSIPLTSFICNAIIRYMPFWQNNYFYMWST